MTQGITQEESIKIFDELFHDYRSVVQPRTKIRIETEGFSKCFPLTVNSNVILSTAGIYFTDWRDCSFRVIKTCDSIIILENLGKDAL
jgi:hypothetical protein